MPADPVVVTPAQRRVLAMLARGPLARAHDAQADWRIAVAWRLAARGLAARSTCDVGVRYEITAAGRAALERGRG